jgi:hypothetical protein
LTAQFFSPLLAARWPGSLSGILDRASLVSALHALNIHAGDSIVYVVRNARTGQLLKIEKTKVSGPFVS